MWTVRREREANLLFLYNFVNLILIMTEYGDDFVIRQQEVWYLRNGDYDKQNIGKKSFQEHINYLF